MNVGRWMVAQAATVGAAAVIKKLTEKNKPLLPTIIDHELELAN